jgi:hypothetical protein
MVVKHLRAWKKMVGCIEKGTSRAEDILYCTTKEKSLVRVPGVYSELEKNRG